MTTDSLSLAQDLIRAKSITPDSGVALDVLQSALEGLGFTCHLMTFHEEGEDSVPNLYARRGDTAPNFCFAGHTDVVPLGVEDHWDLDPFGAEVIDGYVWGRGAADMKAAIAAFVAAADRHIEKTGLTNGSLSFLITGDEEGPAINGTKKVLTWLQEQNETLDYCLVGEPTNPNTLGEMMKIGRRGSLHGIVHTKGVQGHVAYPHLAENPIPSLVSVLHELGKEPLDSGNDHFQPSNLEIVNIDCDNENDSHNVIVAKAWSRFNVRFASTFTPEELTTELSRRMDRAGVKYDVDWWVSGDAFLTAPGKLSDAIASAVEKRLGVTPELSTTGGTSDARFIKDMCPVVEFGLVGKTMHKTNECVGVADLEALTDIYEHIIAEMLA